VDFSLGDSPIHSRMPPRRASSSRDPRWSNSKDGGALLVPAGAGYYVRVVGCSKNPFHRLSNHTKSSASNLHKFWNCIGRCCFGAKHRRGRSLQRVRSAYPFGNNPIAIFCSRDSEVRLRRLGERTRLPESHAGPGHSV